MPTIGGLSVQYVNQRRQQGRFTGKTPRTVASVLDRFCEQAGSQRDPLTLTTRDFERWLERDVAISTKRTQFSIVHAWVDWMVEHRYLRRDPTAGVKPPRAPRSVPHRVYDDEVVDLLGVLPDVRAEAIVLLMSEQGLRCCEVASLELGDVDLRGMTLRITGKGGDERQIPLCEQTASAIRRYLAEHPAANGPLIRSYRRPRNALGPGYLGSLVAQWLSEAGLRPERVGGQRGQFPSAHWMRHGAAQAAVDNGAHPRTIQTMLGHASLQTVSRYTGRAGMDEMRGAMEGRRLRRSVGARLGSRGGDRSGCRAADDADPSGEGSDTLVRELEPGSHLVRGVAVGESP